MNKNLKQLIEQRQGEGSDKLDRTIQIHDESDIHSTSYNLHKKLRDLIKSEIAQTATLTARQTLLDVLAGLPEEKQDGDDGMTGVGADVHNTTIQTVRAQIEGLLGKIE